MLSSRTVRSTNETVINRKGQKMTKETFSSRISFLRAGWWLIHLAGIAAVYSLGHILWK